MWNTTKRPFPNLEERDVGNKRNEVEARKEALAKEIEAYLHGDSRRHISERQLASMSSGARRLLTLRNGLLFATYRAYRRGEKTRTSLQLGVLVLISVFSDSDEDGFCWLSQERMADFLNTERTNINRVINEAEEAGLIIKVAERGSFSNGYILAIPSVLADSTTSVFNMLDALAPREREIRPRGRRREVGRRVRNADVPTLSTSDTGDRTITSDGNSRESTVTGVVDWCAPMTITGVTVGSPDTSTDPSDEEEDLSIPGPTDFSFFNGPGAPRESTDEVAPSPLAPPAQSVDYATWFTPETAHATNVRWAQNVALPNDLVQIFAEIIAWCPPRERPSEWRPNLDLDLARTQLESVIAQADAASHPDDRLQALRDAVCGLKGKFDEAEAAIARSQSDELIRKPVSYLSKVFRDRLRKIPIERHKDQLAMRNATLKAQVDAKTEIEIGHKKIAAFSSAVDRNAKVQQKIADGREARAGSLPRAKGRSLPHGMIVGDDGSKSFDRDAEVMTVHRTKIFGRDANTIMASFGQATTDDVIDALRLVEERNKPQTNGKSDYFDPPPVNTVIGLATGYLPAATLHNLHGAPEKFVDGPVAMKSDLAAVGQRWLEDLLRRMPDLTHVKSIGDGVRALNLSSDVISGSKAFLSASHQHAVFKIVAFSATCHLEKYGHELTRWVEAEMEAHLSLINDLGRASREKSEAEHQRASSAAPAASGNMLHEVPLQSAWPRSDRADSHEPTH